MNKLKIIKLIEILEKNGVKIRPRNLNNISYNADKSIVNKEGQLYFGEDLTVETVGQDINRTDIYDSRFNDMNSYKCNRMIVISELFENISFAQKEKYNEIVESYIVDEFEIIEHEDLLMNYLKNDSFFRELYYVINEYPCKNAEWIKNIGKEKSYSFGNKYYEDLDVIKITIFEDLIKYYYLRSGSENIIPLSNDSKSLDNCIFSVIRDIKKIYD